MMLATRVKRQLITDNIPYRILNNIEEVNPKQVGVPASIVVHTKLIRLCKTVYAVILPNDIQEVREYLQHYFNTTDIDCLNEDEANKYFLDCQPGAIPPITKPYHVAAIVDSYIFNFDYVYFNPGAHSALVRLASKDFKYLLRDTISLKLSNSKIKNNSVDITTKHSPHKQTIATLKHDYKIPQLPKIAYKLLNLAESEKGQAEDLLKIINSDSTLAKKVLATAQTVESDFSSNQRLGSLQLTGHKVLDFSTVSHVAIGMIATDKLTLPSNGPLGLKAFWRHALLCGMSANLLAKSVKTIPILPNMAYLSGLLHNFGILLLGSLFVPEFNTLNRLMLHHPKTSITLLEKKIVGFGNAQSLLALGHAKLGELLLQAWDLPEVITTVAREHHVSNYSGAHKPYVWLIQIVSYLLSAYDIGDSQLVPSKQMWSYFGLNPKQAKRTIDALLKQQDKLESIVNSLDD